MEVAKGLIECIEVVHEPGLSHTQLFLSVRHEIIDRVIQNDDFIVLHDHRMRIFHQFRKKSKNGNTGILWLCTFFTTAYSEIRFLT